MAAKTNPYLHDRFDVRHAANLLTQTIIAMKTGGIVDREVRFCYPGEVSQLVIDEMGCKDGVNRNYCVTLRFFVRDVVQSMFPALQKFGKAAGMVLVLDARQVPSPAIGVAIEWVRISFVAYANILT